MVVESDTKLKSFYKSNIRDQAICDDSNTVDSSFITQEDGYASDDIGNSKPIDTQFTQRENITGPPYPKLLHSLLLPSEIPDESNLAVSKDQVKEYTDNFCMNSDNQLAQEEIIIKGDEICDEQPAKQCEEDSSNVIMKCEESVNEVSVSTEKILPHQLLGQIKPCDECNSDGKLKINQPIKKPKPFTNRNINEQQAELVDNPDFKRIMEMNLSRKEKKRQTVFCKECNKTLTFAYFVDKHVHFHTGNLPFKCDKCGLAYPKRSTLNKHLRKHDTARNFSCEECGKTFRSIHAVKQHKFVHSDEKPYSCDICGKSLKYALSLAAHMRIHKNEKNHVCEICGKAFVDYSILRVHIMRHTVSEKNFECKICGKKFALKKDLDHHGQIHSNKRPHVCNECGKSFVSKEILKKHQLIHTGEKPHACKVCGKRFRQNGCISRHMRVHTGETPFSCDLCKSAFKYKHHLQNHMKVHEK